MPLAVRQANAVWQGSLMEGSGEVNSASGAFGPLPVTWEARAKTPGGKTSPEELIAAAQAACFAMAFSNSLAQQGQAPERLDVNCSCTFDMVDGAPTITTLAIEVQGTVPGMNEADFEKAANEAASGCPVARAFQGNVDITLKAGLAS